MPAVHYDGEHLVNGAFNAALAQCESEWVCLTHDDTAFPPAWAELAAGRLAALPDRRRVVGLTGPFSQDGVRFPPLERPCLHQCFPPVSTVLRRSFWEELGGFDEAGIWYDAHLQAELHARDAWLLHTALPAVEHGGSMSFLAAHWDKPAAWCDFDTAFTRRYGYPFERGYFGTVELGPEPADYAAYLTPARIDSEEPYWPESNARYAAAARELIERHGLASVLEVGCGTGHVPAALPAGVRYTGIDRNPECLRRARLRNPGRLFREGDCRYCPLPPADCVCAFALFKHFPEREWVEACARVLQGGSYGLFTLNLADVVLDDGADYPHLWVTEADLARMLARAGHRELERRLLWEGAAGGLTGREVLVCTRRGA